MVGAARVVCVAKLARTRIIEEKGFIALRNRVR